MGGCVGDEYINGRAIALGHSITLRITAASHDINDYFFFYFDGNITEEKKKNCVVPPDNGVSTTQTRCKIANPKRYA